MNMLVNRKYPPIPVPVSTNQTLNATSQTYGGTNAGAVQAGGGNQASVASLSNVASKFVVHPEIAEELQVVSNDNARYTFTSRGGGLKKVELLRYADTARFEVTIYALAGQQSSSLFCPLRHAIGRVAADTWVDLPLLPTPRSCCCADGPCLT